MSPDFTPLASLAGGALIGFSASLMLLVEGRIAGISGIVGGLLNPKPGDMDWRLAFVGGLVLAGLVGQSWVTAAPMGAPWRLIVAGLLVGVGTRLGNGCTSGHGVCGLSRLSPRSLASVLTFMAVGMGVASGMGWLNQ